MAVNLTLVYDSNTRRAYPGEMKITPLYIASQRKDGKNVYRVVDAEDEQALSKLTIGRTAVCGAGGSAGQTGGKGRMTMNKKRIADYGIQIGCMEKGRTQ